MLLYESLVSATRLALLSSACVLLTASLASADFLYASDLDKGQIYKGR